MKILDLTVRDIRFPTSRQLDGSDAMVADPDYSATYVVLHTDGSYEGHGLAFTIGRGNEVVVAGVKALAPRVIGKTLESFTENMGEFWRMITGDSQLRWVGPEKGVIHLATAAVVNAVWDLWAKVEGKPLWKLLVDLSSEELVRCVDFRYITDAITPDEALALLKANEATRSQREAEMLQHGYQAYTTSSGWLGYSDEKIRRLCREALAGGWTHFKLKVGADIEDDVRRCAIVRAEIGGDCKLMVDANQIWDVGEAITNMRLLAPFKPWWIEEPTSPDDLLGHATIRRAVAPIGVATGEHCMNRVMFKQFMQAQAIDYCQVDCCRLGGVNEVIAVYLLAAKFGIPVCPHAGGVGLCEYVQHLQVFDYICVSAALDNRIIEYVDHLHEHFINPVVIRSGHYIPPQEPGYSIEMKPVSLAQYEFPWRGDLGVKIIDSHVHFWRPQQFRYNWLREIEALNRPFAPGDFAEAASGTDVEGAIFVQADCAPEQAIAEAQWVASLNGPVKGIVAFAPLEGGPAARVSLDALAQIPLVKGIRRLIQSEASGFAVQPNFVTGVRLLAEYNLAFDICIAHRQLVEVVTLVEQCPNVRFVLDHIGKPGIASGEIDGWRQQITRLARLGNVSCKLSGLVTEADHAHWQIDDLRPFVQHVLAVFGAGRLMFGSDWPVCLLATTYGRWLETLQDLLEPLSTDEK